MKTLHGQSPTFGADQAPKGPRQCSQGRRPWDRHSPEDPSPEGATEALSVAASWLPTSTDHGFQGLTALATFWRPPRGLPRSSLAASVLCLVLGLALPSTAQDDLAARAKAIVTELGSDDYETRERASAALVELGEAAIPALDAARTSPDPEVHTRAENALAQILFRRDAEPSAWITLPKGRIDLEVGFRELARQAGRPFDPGGVALAGKSFDSTGERMPIWQALDLLARAGGCSYALPFHERIALDPTPLPDAPRCYAGPLRLTGSVDRLNRTEKSWRFEVSAECERRASPTYHGGSGLTEIVDDQGVSLLWEEPVPAPSRGGFSLARLPAKKWNSLKTIRPPSRDAKRIARARGTAGLFFERAREETTLPVSEPPPGPTTTGFGHQIVLVSSKREAGDIAVSLHLLPGDGVEPRSCRFSSFELMCGSIEVSLCGADGQEFEVGEYGSVGGMGEPYEVEFLFLDVPEGEYTLHLSWVTDLVGCSFPFQFHDVPIDAPEK